MKKNVLLFGLISSIITFIMMGISVYLFYKDPNASISSMIVGFTGMFIAFSFIFVAQKKIRDEQNGVLTFKDALVAALLITLMASTTYVVGWMLEFHFIFPDFMDRYADSAIRELQAKGASQVKIDAQIAEMADMREKYKNPIYRAAITYAEILPLGLIVSLVSSLIMKRKPKAI
jgi:hypothetical protein